MYICARVLCARVLWKRKHNSVKVEYSMCMYYLPIRSGMQRGGNSTIRMVTAVSLGALAVVTFLYLMKRVEFNKTSRELQLVKVCICLV